MNHQGGFTMKIRLIAIALLCLVGVALFIGCKEESSKNIPLIPLSQQRVLYEIPKGVAQ
jgi:hypothetical protein